MMRSQLSQRRAWMDTAKGVAMLLVLVGHCMRDEMRTASPALDYLYRGIYGFHMSWFFWLSGISYALSRAKGRPPLQIAARRLKQQFPYWLGYGLFIFLVFTVAMALPVVGNVLRDAGYEALSLGAYLREAFLANNPWAYHLWFLYVLILLTVIVSLCDAALGGKHSRAVWIGLMALSLIGLALRDTVSVGQWWRLYDYVTLYLPLFCLGALMAEWEVPDTAARLWGMAGLGYLIVRTAFFSGFSGNSVRVDGMARFALYLLADALLPGLMVWLKLIFTRFCLPRTALGKSFIGFLGRESLAVYLWHQPFCCAFLGLVLYGRLGLPALVTMAVCFAASLGVSWVYVQLRSRLRPLLSRKSPT